jgi:hypothetical protein
MLPGLPISPRSSHIGSHIQSAVGVVFEDKSSGDPTSTCSPQYRERDVVCVRASKLGTRAPSIEVPLASPRNTGLSGAAGLDTLMFDTLLGDDGVLVDREMQSSSIPSMPSPKKRVESASGSSDKSATGCANVASAHEVVGDSSRLSFGVSPCCRDKSLTEARKKLTSSFTRGSTVKIAPW